MNQGINKGETYTQRLFFYSTFLFKMVLPPIVSLKRLETVCISWLNKNPIAYTPRKSLADLYSFYQMYEESKQEFVHLQELGYLTDSDKTNFAEVLYKLKAYQDVVDLLHPVCEKQPEGYRINKYLGRSFLLLGLPAKGVEHFERVKNSKKFTWDDYKDLGLCYYDLKCYEEALAFLEKALALNPQSNLVQEMIGVVYSKRGEEYIETDLARAEEDFNKSLKYWPDSQTVPKLLNKIQEMRREEN